MKIIGIDFTSAPRHAKPITACLSRWDGEGLRVEQILDLYSFAAFEELLCSQGPWVAGMDFPFGQSRRLILRLRWPPVWEEYVRRFAALSRVDFVKLLEDYKSDRPTGDREHRRRVDVLARSISPQKLYGVPVGKMFFEGAPRLLRAGVNLPLLRPNQDERIVLETYPALVARRFVGKEPYKNDLKSRQTQGQARARKAIVDGIRAAGDDAYGLSVVLSRSLRKRLIDDPTADRLDAVLCALQAAWAWVQRGQGYGIPPDADAAEGWICDPLLYRPTPPVRNLLVTSPAATAGEVTSRLTASAGVRIERIVSHGQVSPSGFWYDQDEHEYVLLLQGEARLEIDGETDERKLGPGDALLLPAGCRHRVSYTAADRETVWLAIFYPAEEG